MQGYLLVDKPVGWTSFDVVNYIRRQVATIEGKKPKNCKVGHTGTLDPAATGLLMILVGKDYTRQAASLMKHDKTYEVTMRLGQVSTTGDGEGELSKLSDIIHSKEEIEAVLQNYTGDLMQTPPAFSAMKINGQRAYKLAREGKPVELEARPIRIYSNELNDYEYPDVTFTSQVGSGTYIRSLVADIGAELGTGAYMAALRRTAIAEHSIEKAMTPDQVTVDTLPALLTTLHTDG